MLHGDPYLVIDGAQRIGCASCSTLFRTAFYAILLDHFLNFCAAVGREGFSSRGAYTLFADSLFK